MTLRVTPRLFSGRVNPTWTLDDAAAVDVLRELHLSPGVVDGVGAPPCRLGFSGLQIDVGSDLLAAETGLPSTFFIGTGRTSHESRAQEIAARLVETMPQHRSGETLLDGASDEGLRSLLLEEIAEVSTLQSGSPLTTVTEQELSVELSQSPDPSGSLDASCTVESGEYKPGFWNDGSTVQLSNNCYSYAANRRIDKFGIPGKGGGRMVRPPFTKENVVAAMLADGLKPHGSCLPETEKPRYLIALVIAPLKPGDPNYNDFHFFRNSVQSLSNQTYFWSHKPGQCPVINIDNSGRIITNVERANRGKYTIFGGYFYLSKSSKIDGIKVGGFTD